jgi:YidC/Oxa1 family membrane protein insertase
VTVFANIFQPLIDVFETVIIFFHDSIGLSWGWSIVVLTIIVRACLLPSSSSPCSPWPSTRPR